MLQGYNELLLRYRVFDIIAFQQSTGHVSKYMRNYLIYSTKAPTWYKFPTLIGPDTSGVGF